MLCYATFDTITWSIKGNSLLVLKHACFEWLCLKNPGVPRYRRERLTRKQGSQFSSSKGLNTAHSCMGALLMITCGLWCTEQRRAQLCAGFCATVKRQRCVAGSGYIGDDFPGSQDKMNVVGLSLWEVRALMETE